MPEAPRRPVTPPGWPRSVRPPDAPRWEDTAVAWLLDISPPEYRSYPVLRRHPVILVRFVAFHVEASHAACQRALSQSRGAMRDLTGLGIDADVVHRAIDTWHTEAARLLAERRAVGLVEEALRGRRFVERL